LTHALASQGPHSSREGLAKRLAQGNRLTSGLTSVSSSGTGYKNVSGAPLTWTTSGHAEADASLTG